jgi:hypothetical protein
MRIFGKKTSMLSFLISIFVIFGILLTSSVLFRNSGVVENMSPSEISSLTDPGKGFCETYRGNSRDLESQCNSMSQSTCSSLDCCVWTSNSKCVAGGKNGPTFKTGNNGEKITTDSYYYKNTCYGNCK